MRSPSRARLCEPELHVYVLSDGMHPNRASRRSACQQGSQLRIGGTSWLPSARSSSPWARAGPRRQGGTSLIDVMRTVSRCCCARHGRPRSPKGGRRHDICGMRPAHAHAAGGRAGHGLRQPATRLLLPDTLLGCRRLRPRLSFRFVTAIRSKWASRRCASAHAVVPNSRSTLSCARAQSGHAVSKTRLPFNVSRIALMRPSGCGTRSITRSRSKRLRLRVRVVWSMASVSSSCFRCASPMRAIIARMLN